MTIEHVYPEASLSKLEVVQTQLAENERELQHEITALQEDLRKEQDPTRMQAIQEMISVCSPVLLRVIPLVTAAKCTTIFRNC